MYDGRDAMAPACAAATALAAATVSTVVADLMAAASSACPNGVDSWSGDIPNKGATAAATAAAADGGGGGSNGGGAMAGAGNLLGKAPSAPPVVNISPPGGKMGCM